MKFQLTKNDNIEFSVSCQHQIHHAIKSIIGVMRHSDMRGLIVSVSEARF